MALSPFGLPAQTLTTSAASVCTAPGNTQTNITAATAFNSSAGAVKMTVYRVSSGGSAATSNLIAEKTLATREAYSCPELLGQTLEPGAAIWALADAASAINIHISGYTKPK
jgi:hypothetical protein